MLGNKEIMAKNIKKYMNIHNVTRNKMSEALKVSYSTLSDWINAKTYPRIDKIEMMADYFNISKSDLVEESKTMSTVSLSTVPIVSKVSAGNPTYSEEDIISYTYVPENMFRIDKDLFGLEISGDSMDKEFKEGDVVIVEKGATVENGQLGIVMVNGYDGTVKRIRYNDNKIILYPESNNPEHLPQVYDKDDEVYIVGRVVSSQKFY